MNTVVGDLDGNRDAHRRAARASPRGGRRARPLPRARRDRLSARGPAPPARLPARGRREPRGDRRRDEGDRRLVGTPHLDRDLFNACAVCVDGEVKAIYHKQFLPNYGVFDEDRYFQAGRELVLLRCGDTLIGPTVCEDIWQPGPPATDLALAGAHVVANISASPFHLGKGAEREDMLATRARDNSCWIAFVNAVGAQDELIFDGPVLVLDEEGRSSPAGPRSRRRSSSSTWTRPPRSAAACATRGAGLARAQARASESSRGRGSPSAPSGSVEPELAPTLDELEQMRRALELGLGDYVAKNGFHDVVLGISGGIDSALTAALAAETLGPSGCTASRCRPGTARTRRGPTRSASPSLGADYIEIPIEPIVESVRHALARAFEGTEPGWPRRTSRPASAAFS